MLGLPTSSLSRGLMHALNPGSSWGTLVIGTETGQPQPGWLWGRHEPGACCHAQLLPLVAP